MSQEDKAGAAEGCRMTMHIKSVKLTKVGGSLTFTGDFNALLLVGEERQLVSDILDLMLAFEVKKVKTDDVCPECHGDPEHVKRQDVPWDQCATCRGTGKIRSHG